MGTATTDANGNYVFGGVNNTSLLPDPSCSASTTANLQVNASENDAYQLSDNSVTITDTRTRIGGAVNASGTRFTNVNIPQGAIITNAYIQYTPNNVSNVNTGTPVITISGDNADNTPAYTATSNNITARPDTTTVTWNIPAANWADNDPAGANQRTPDLSTIVQQIVNRSGWTSGNAMAFTLIGSGTTSRRDAESFDGTPADAPRLVIEYAASNCTYKVNPNTAYEVRIPSSNFSGGALNNFVPTTPNNDGSANGNLRDSDGIVVSGTQVFAPFTTGTSGQNNHSFDFGFRANGGGGASIYSIGNRIWFDTNNDGIINSGEVGISGVSVSVLNSSNGVVGGPITTDANGYYRFDGLAAGTYTVRINPSNFTGTGVFRNYRNTSNINTAPLDSSGATVNAENGVDPTGATNSVLTNGILSNSVTLNNSSPTAEPNVPLSGTYAGQGSLDNQADVTIDLGFYKLCLTGTIWNDTSGAGNNDGLLNNGETGIKAIRVRLFDSGGTEIPVGSDGILGTADDAIGWSI